MTTLRTNKDEGVTLNEITISFVVEGDPTATVEWDPRGIVSAEFAGHLGKAVASDRLKIRAVNVSFDGVSVDCDVEWLSMLADAEVRKAFVERVKAEAAKAEVEAAAPAERDAAEAERNEE